MGDVGDFWRDVRPSWDERSRQKRADNRERSAAILREKDITFESKNNDAHLIITSPAGVTFDFWPGTGLWQRRGNKRQSRGVFKLLRAIREAKP